MIQSEAEARAGELGPVSGGYRAYAMCLLLSIYIVNFLDRQVVNILAEPIKNDLGLADWQVGVMGGLAFAVLYTFLGLPIARLAERGNRPLIIGVAAGVWSIFTALCGLAQNFVQLVLARVGVGVGEAGCTPPAHSLIIDYSPKEKRSSALAFYGMGAPLGGLLGMAFGGLVADAYGWRTAFFLAGTPGIILAVLAATTLKETRRTIRNESSAKAIEPPSLKDTVRLVVSKRSFQFCIAAISVKAFIATGYSVFLASFFLRNHGPEVSEMAQRLGGLQSVGFLGLTLGLLSGLFGALGMWLGGQLADRVAGKDPRRLLYGCALAALLHIPAFVAAVTFESLPLALCFMAVSGLVSSAYYGPALSSLFSVVPAQMRATTSAIMLFVTNLIGLGLGPVAVGLVSDAYAAQLGPAEGLRWALVTASSLGLVAAGLFWSGARTLREDVVG